MNFIKRAGLSLVHSAKNNLLLILLFVVIATLILTGLCIQSATAQESAAVRRELGGEVALYPPGKNGVAGTIPLGTVSRVAKLAHVKASNYIMSITAYAVDFNVVSDESDISSVGKNESAPVSDTILMGMTNSQQFDDFTNGTFKLTQGRHLTAADDGKPYALIEQTLAQQDHLKSGDSVTMESTTGNGNKTKLTVIGVYQNTKEASGFSSDPVRDPGNMLLVPYTQISGLTGNTDLNYADYYMDDPINIDSFKNEVAKLNLPKNDVLDAQDSVYRRMAGPLNNLNMISVAMVVGVIIAGAVILSLMVVLNLKGRKYEIGVLLSIGERKLHIIAQMALEILVPILIAFTLSIATGHLAAQKIGSAMFFSQVQSQNSISASQQGSAVIQDDSNGKRYTQVDKINASVTVKDIAELYLAGILLALLSTAVPLVMVMRYQPKDILIQIE